MYFQAYIFRVSTVVMRSVRGLILATGGGPSMIQGSKRKMLCVLLTTGQVKKYREIVAFPPKKPPVENAATGPHSALH